MSFVNTTNSFEKIERNFSKQEEKLTTYSVRSDLFQINTFTTLDNKKTGHADQGIQFDVNGLRDLVAIIKDEYPSVFREQKNMQSFDVPLFDIDGKLQYCFRWGFEPDGITLRSSARTGNEAYIALPPQIYKSDFYPANPKTFSVKTDDGKVFIFKRAQKDENGQALETTDDNGQEGNKELGKYLRSRLGITSGTPITRDAVLKYGNDKITLSKDSVGNFCLSFRPGIKFEKQPLILYGSPGTGKTYRMQHDYIDKFAKEDRFVTTFHQSFSYEEFVEGLKPVLSSADETEGTASDVKYTIEKGIFYKACERAAELAGYEPTETESSIQKCIADSEHSTKMKEAIENNKIVLLCIDEINRANVSAVFGDLISLIEPSKRIGAEHEMSVFLPYSKETFAVPANLMIVGTMNTADRSIQLLDSALRRRFRFEELLPDYTTITNENARAILQNINVRIRCLLDKDHQIGHSYFIEAKTDLDIFNALKDCVIPLLEEYFYNDTHKIRQILNEKDNVETNFYVKDTDAGEASAGMESDFDDDKEFYQLNPKLSEIKDDAEAAQFLKHITAKTAE